MIFHETPIIGAFMIELERKLDERGFFARAFCEDEFRQHGIDFRAVQANLSHGNLKGTLRGMHYQDEPVREPKLIRCVRGAVWDVIIDMRPQSATYLSHHAVELTPDNGLAIFVPDRCAHGNQALVDHSELLYLMGGPYIPGFERGVRFDDPTVGIQWPLPVTSIHPKDLGWPLIVT